MVRIDERTAKKKANGWLVDHIGNMVTAGDGTLATIDNTWVWRFAAYLTGLSHDPYGPIGHVDVDANTGDVVIDLNAVEMMYRRGEHFIHTA